jgi:hypothetical protein
MSRKPTKQGSPERARIADQVLAGMGKGLSAFKAAEAAGIPHSTFLGWLDDDADLADRYTRARENLIERMANELLEISDKDVEIQDGKRDWAAVQKHKLQVDTRKWLLSKLAPKKYGDKVGLELTGEGGGPIQILAATADERL